MIADRWYCIAQTGTFDSGCIITVSFDGYLVQLSVRVKYGMSAINITRCQLPSNISLSVRLRESSNQWSVDLLSSVEIQPNITISDGPYWTSVMEPSGAGNISLSIKDISRSFNTDYNGAASGLDVEQLKLFLKDNGYTALLDFWEKDEQNNAIYTPFNIRVKGDGVFGGDYSGEGDTPSLGKVTITIPNFVEPFESDENGNIKLPAYPTELKNPKPLKINGVTYDGSKEIEINVSESGGIADSVAWDNVIGKPTALSEFENDTGFIAEKDILESDDQGIKVIKKNFLPPLQQGEGIIIDKSKLKISMNVDNSTFGFEDNKLILKQVDGGYL